MPIIKRGSKYYWGNQGPFPTREKAEEVAQAAYSSGYQGKAVQKLASFVELSKRAGVDNSQFSPDEVPDYMNSRDRNWWGNEMYQYNLTPEQNLPRNTRGEPNLQGRKRTSDYLLGPEGAGGTSQPLEENAGQQNREIDPQAKRRYDQQQQMGMNYPPGHPNRGRDQGYLGASYYRKQPRLRQDPHLPFDTGYNPFSDTYPMYSAGQDRPYTPLPFRDNNMGDWYPKHEGDEGPYSSHRMHEYRKKVGLANSGAGEHPTFKEHIDAWAQAGLEDTNGWWFGHVPHNPDIHPEDYHEALQTPTSIHDFLPLIRNAGIQAMPYGTSLPKHYKRGQGQGGMTFERWTKTLLDSHEGDDYWGIGNIGKSVQKLNMFVSKTLDLPESHDVSQMPTIKPEDVNNMGLDKNHAQMVHEATIPNVGTVNFSNAIKGPGTIDNPQGRTTIVATLPNGERQPFYTRTLTGGNEGATQKGDFSLYDGHNTGSVSSMGLGWFDKMRFFNRSLPNDHPIQRHGSKYHRDIAHYLDAMTKAGKIPSWEELVEAGHKKLPGQSDENNHGPWSFLEINHWLGTPTSLQHNIVANNNNDTPRYPNWSEHNRHLKERGDYKKEYGISNIEKRYPRHLLTIPRGGEMFQYFRPGIDEEDSGGDSGGRKLSPAALARGLGRGLRRGRNIRFQSPFYLKPEKSVDKLMKFIQKDVSRFTPEELNQLEADEGVRFNREALETPRGAIPQAGRQARPYARPVGLDPDSDLSSHAYGADDLVGPMGENRYTGRGLRAEFPSWAQDYGPTPQEWNAISQPDTPEERWSREQRIGMMTRQAHPDDEVYDEGSYSPSEWASRNPKKAVQKLLQFLRKEDGEPEYHPVTGRRMAPRQQSGSLTPRGGGMLDYGEIENTTFPQINTYIDEPQEERSVVRHFGSPQAHNIPIRRFPSKFPEPADFPGKSMNAIQDEERKHDYVDELRADPKNRADVPGGLPSQSYIRQNWSGPISYGAFHNGQIHKWLDELYGRSHYRMGGRPMTPWNQGSDSNPHPERYKDLLSVHPHNEFLFGRHSSGQGDSYQPKTGEIIDSNATHNNLFEPPQTVGSVNAIGYSLYDGEGSATDWHNHYFGNPNSWAWNQHGLYRRMLRRGEPMRFSSHMFGHAMGAEAINARNKAPYGFTSHGERISPATHGRDWEPPTDAERDTPGPARWEDADGTPIENTPLLSYIMPQSLHDDPTKSRTRRLHYFNPRIHLSQRGDVIEDIPAVTHQQHHKGSYSHGNVTDRGEIFENSADSDAEAVTQLLGHLKEWYADDEEGLDDSPVLEDSGESPVSGIIRDIRRGDKEGYDTYGDEPQRHHITIMPNYMHHAYGTYAPISMDELDDLGPISIDEFHQLIENRDGWHIPGDARGYDTHPYTGADYPSVSDDQSRPFRGSRPWNHSNENSVGRRFPVGHSYRSGNFMPKQDLLSREAQLQYHQRLASMWGTDPQSSSWDDDLFTAPPHTRIYPYLQKAGYFLNPSDPFGQNNPWKFNQGEGKWAKRRREDMPSQGRGNYGEGVRDILGSPNIASDPMSEFAQRGQRREMQQSTFRPYGTAPVDPAAWKHAMEGGTMIPGRHNMGGKEEFNPNLLHRPQAPEHNRMALPAPGAGTLAFSPINYDNAQGSHNKRAFDEYMKKIGNGMPMSWHEHWAGLQHGIDYHNHTAKGINTYLADKENHEMETEGKPAKKQGLYHDDLFETVGYPHIITNRLSFPRTLSDHKTGKGTTYPQPLLMQGFSLGGVPDDEGRNSRHQRALENWHYNDAHEPPEGVHAIIPKYEPSDASHWGRVVYNVGRDAQEGSRSRFGPWRAGEGPQPSGSGKLNALQAGMGHQILMTLPEFLGANFGGVSGAARTIPSDTFHPNLPGNTPMTVNDTGKSLHSSSTGIRNPEWDELMNARWNAWMDFLTHVENTWDASGKGGILKSLFLKEGDGGGDGGAFNGLSDTVFTSTNAGIFTPTYGGHKTRRKHEKRHKRQEKKRKKLLGKEKKSGVDRLVQYLYDGSPNMSKARKPDKMIQGNPTTAHAWNNKSTGRKILDWQKVAEGNEPHINMGLAGGMEASMGRGYPQKEDPSVMNGEVPRRAEWENGYYVQKEDEVRPRDTRRYFYDPERGEESPEGEHMPPHVQANETRKLFPEDLEDLQPKLPPNIENMQKLSSDGSITYMSPTDSASQDPKHPQQPYIKHEKNSPGESPAKDAVVKENDMQRRVKKYDNKEEDTGHEQPAGAMAAVGMGHYPSGATMQMSMAAGGINPDALERGGDKDIEDPEVTDEESDLDWVELPEAEKKLESMRKALEEAGDENPILNALLKVDYA